MKMISEFISRLFNDIKEHPLPFLISLILSIMLFYYITNIGVESLLTVGDLHYNLMLNDLFVINKQNIKVKVTLRGKPQDLKLVNEDIIKPYLNITANKPGDYTYKVNIDQAYLPENVRIVKIDPSSVSVSLDKIFKKKVKLEANIAGKPQTGYSVSKVSFTKSEYVVVEGPYSILSKVESVKTNEISIDGINFPLVLPIKLENESLKIISPSDNQVIIDIKPLKILKVIKDIPILLSNKNNKFNYSLSQNKFEISLLTTQDLADKISSSDFIFVIDCSYFQNYGVYTIKIIPKFIDSITIISTSPEFVELTINTIEVVN